jgi:hypothetical protein
MQKRGVRKGVIAMKQIVLATLCLFILLPHAATGRGIKQQGSQPGKPGAGAPTFSAFWTKFNAAVIAGDKAGVASMTQLPFQFEDKDLDRPGFIAKFDTIFTSKVKKCFARAKPTMDQDYYEVFCGQSIFMFKKVSGQYMFVEIGVND